MDVVEGAKTKYTETAINRMKLGGMNMKKALFAMLIGISILLSACKNEANLAFELKEQGRNLEAAEAFQAMGDQENYMGSLIAHARQMLGESKKDEARSYFEMVAGMGDFMGEAEKGLRYLDAMDAIAESRDRDAAKLLQTLGDYEDGEERLKEVNARIAQEDEAQGAINKKEAEELTEYLETLGYDGDFWPMEDLPKAVNVLNLLRRDFFSSQDGRDARLLVDNECYDVIEYLLGDALPENKSAYFDRGDMPFTALEDETILRIDALMPTESIHEP